MAAAFAKSESNREGSCSLQQFAHAPNVIRDSGGHCGCNAERFVDAAEVVERKPARDRGLFRDAVLSILATIAKQERVRRSERASAAIAKLRRQGKTDHLGRPRLVVDRDKAQSPTSLVAPKTQTSTFSWRT
jgi:hypothetical protein